MQYHAIPSNNKQHHSIPCNTVQYCAIPCNNMQYHAIPCITMQYHAPLITADGAYHCPVVSIRTFFHHSHMSLVVLSLLKKQKNFQSILLLFFFFFIFSSSLQLPGIILSSVRLLDFKTALTMFSPIACLATLTTVARLKVDLFSNYNLFIITRPILLESFFS